jgi:hypothetical protein
MFCQVSLDWSSTRMTLPGTPASVSWRAKLAAFDDPSVPVDAARRDHQRGPAVVVALGGDLRGGGLVRTEQDQRHGLAVRRRCLDVHGRRDRGGPLRGQVVVIHVRSLPGWGRGAGSTRRVPASTKRAWKSAAVVWG